MTTPAAPKTFEDLAQLAFELPLGTDANSQGTLNERINACFVYCADEIEAGRAERDNTAWLSSCWHFIVEDAE
jgi:hypothetical protein